MTELVFDGIIERYNIERKSGGHGMNKKILLTLLSGIIALSMIGCEKKVASTGDPDLDAAIKEVHDAFEESANEESSNMESESLDSNDTTKIDIQKSYLVNRDDENYMIIYFSQKIPFDDSTEITITGVNSGSKKELYNVNIDRLVLQPFGKNNLYLPLFASPTDNVLAFKVDWDGYQQYLLSIKQYQIVLGQPNKLLNESNYFTDDTRFVKMSYEDFLNEHTKNLFDSLDYTKTFKNGDIKFEYLGSTFSEEGYKVDFAVTNEGNVPSDRYRLLCNLLTKDGQCESNSVGHGRETIIEAINPGETINVSYTSRNNALNDISRFKVATGDDFIFQIELAKMSGVLLDTTYLKAKL